MTNGLSQGRYTATAVTLHWLVALGIFGAFSLGLYMHELPLSPTKLKLYSYHKWAGVTIFLFVLIRLAWRATHPPPPLPAAMPAWQRTVAHALHHLLYLLMVAIPITGWLMSSAKGFQTVWFGLVPLPDLLDKNKELGDTLALVHKTLNLTMAALVISHVAAAVKHHVFDRDDVLARMLPFLDNNKVTR
ncbi:MAG TPA: cytochrome b [Rhodocyclaceae bacterium]|nr:cytochrome b [Rhodocyclaceae bacterium]HMV55367.1 cytochrome b [Rhodocyclaceae bacterium]HNA04530.1 cytochrome b [Rhodocyclaceae bacterium]HNB80184.1 cytochrome b [Rhodocyclaceae bacterium]HNC62717.1 cytochrome b [Rhodocyclaceae bacterium]